MSDIDTLQATDPNTGLPVDVTSEVPVLTDVVQPTPATVPETVHVSQSKLKALLLILGHDVEDSWEHIVALAKKI